MNFIYSLISVIIVSAISFVGALTLALNTEKLKKMIVFLVSLAVGGLLGDAFIHLIPETFNELGSGFMSSILILGGLLLFFVMEKFIRWRHCHLDIDASESRLHPVVTMNLIGDGIHNFIDGALIAASFAINVPLGITTTLAVILHEIPQEIGDFGILIKGGLAPKKVLLFNFLSGLVAVLGAVAVFVIGSTVENLFVYLVPITAGGFIYIAGSDLIPDLHHNHGDKPKTSIIQLFAIILGIAIMATLLFIE
ncbi:MAG: ZIP family metal transporter [Candidatus Paceibacterota bacterium]|jgi:zinc and cadmium transporter